MSTPTLDFISLIYTGIWTVLNNDTVWSANVLAANQIRYDQVEGIEEPEKPALADGDYPQASLRLLNGDLDLQTNDVTFGTHSPGGCPQWVENANLVFRLRLTSQLLSQTETDTLLLETINALRQGGPRLGLSYVTSVKIRFTTREVDGATEDDESGGMRRLQHDVDVSVKAEFDGASLTGE